MGTENGAPVILLHGFPYDARAFDEVAPPLAAQGCRVLVPYLRGYGPTRFLSAGERRVRASRRRWATTCCSFMRAVGIGRAALVGLRLGRAARRASWRRCGRNGCAAW